MAYWPLDDAAVAAALDLKGSVPLDVRAGNDTHFRAYRQETSAVPYGAAIEFTHTGGASGLSGVLPTDRVDVHDRRVFPDAGSRGHGERTLSSESAQARCLSRAQARLTITMDGVAPSAFGVIPGVWHHVAVVRTPMAARALDQWRAGGRGRVDLDRRRPHLDGATMSVCSGQRRQSGRSRVGRVGRVGPSDQRGGPGLEAPPRAEVWRIYLRIDVDATEYGPTDTHTFRCNLAGYGLRLDGEFVRHTYASASGSTVRQIVHDVLVRAGLQHEFTSHGVEIDDTVLREVYPVLSVMEILRSLANAHGAIVTADEWKEIDMVRRLNVEHSSLVLRGGRGGNVKAIGRSTEPRFYGNSAIVVGRGERGTVEETHTTDGVTRRYDAGQPIGEILSITLDGVR